MPRIRFYQQDGRLHDEQELTPQSLYDAMGMMARCYLSNGTYRDGFVCFSPGPESQKKDYGSTFFLWTWAHLDEETHRLVGDDKTKYDQNYEPIDFLEVEGIDAILYSNPRWGGLLYNHFFIDTRPYLAMNEVRHIFKSIWCSGREKYWYQNAWNILQKHGMTRYTTERERCEVLLRAVAISMVYEDFCMADCEESPSYDYLYEVDGDISELVLGQLYGAKHSDEIIESYSEAIFILANDLRREVVSAIKSEMNDIEIYAHLMCTVHPPIVEDEDGDEVDFEIENFGDYKKAVKLFLEELPRESVEINEMAVYCWIDEGMSLLGA